jgi:hypothetical protein
MAQEEFASCQTGPFAAPRSATWAADTFHVVHQEEQHGGLAAGTSSGRAKAMIPLLGLTHPLELAASDHGRDKPTGGHAAHIRAPCGPWPPLLLSLLLVIIREPWPEHHPPAAANLLQTYSIVPGALQQDTDTKVSQLGPFPPLLRVVSRLLATHRDTLGDPLVDDLLAPNEPASTPLSQP